MIVTFYVTPTNNVSKGKDAVYKLVDESKTNSWSLDHRDSIKVYDLKTREEYFTNVENVDPAEHLLKRADHYYYIFNYKCSEK